MSASRLLIVSNRLPVTARLTADGLQAAASSGGLATGLLPWHERSGGLWFGWPGDLSGATPAQRGAFGRDLNARRIVPVHAADDSPDGPDHGFSNRVLWPAFHYLIDRVPVDMTGWEAYRAANESFAEAAAREARPHDTIWVHDYQLMLLPAMLRARLPRARIGFFLHIPFPSSEVFRVLPWRSELLDGLLGADLIGFHTFAYLRHFMTSLLHVDGVEADIDRVRIGDREVKLGVFPMGIDAEGYAALAHDPDVQSRVEAIRQDAGGRRIVLGIDRLDYTKGLPRRLQAVERLLEIEPALRDEMRYIQIAVPSRGEVGAYQDFRRFVEERVGRMNGAFGTLRSLPVHYVHQSLSMRDLVALYCAADVMLVTPLRDGMNLVAKEFVASRVDDDGVLVLSEFAGAAAELPDAVTVNPYDIDGVADSLRRALAMSAAERRARMRGLRRRVSGHDVHTWARTFLAQLEAACPLEAAGAARPPGPSLGMAIAGARTTSMRLLLDYDGTLVPFARSPELAVPDEELLMLLHELSATPGIEVDIVSGRPRGTLERWFGHLSIGLWAEHGFWRRRGAQRQWEPAAAVGVDWMDRIRPIIDQFVSATPGSHLETKSASLAWHYRGAARQFGARQAHELRMLLGHLLSNQPLEVVEGRKVIEVRLRGASKSMVAERVRAETPPGTAILAIGDDRIDEELFRALPPWSLTVAVDRRHTIAKHKLDDYKAVRRELLRLVPDTPSDTRLSITDGVLSAVAEA
jgi:trehalose 6-phosphate synthase/phosphatase